MAESLKQIFEGHTDRINHATELLKVLGDREGQFVWKKCKNVTINAAMTTNGTNPVIFQLSSDDVDLSTFTSTDLAGFEGTYTDTTVKDIAFVDATTLRWDGSNTTTYTYDSTTQQVSINGQWGKITLNGFTKQVVDDFVVADNAEAYPDGAELDGYWYEKYEAPSLAELTGDATATAAEILKGYTAYADGELLTGTLVKGATGIDGGIVTVTSANEIKVAHSLGKTPSYAYCIHVDVGKGLDYWPYSVTSVNLDGLPIVYKYSGVDGYSTGAITKSASQVVFKYYNYESKFSGTYVWFVRA